MKATDLLRKDHAAVKRLFTQFGKTTARAKKTRAQIIEKIATELHVHAQIEEEIFYPAALEIDEARPLVEDAKEEHEHVKSLLSEMRGREASGDLAAKVRELKEAVVEHAMEEEQDLFPLVERLGAERLEDLGARLDERRQALVPHGAERGGRKGVRKAA
jgi:hemerythrin superfamily protein